MKKLLAFAALFAVVALTSCKYDDDDLWNSVHGLENRVAKLEELCKQMNTNISSLQTIVTALQNNVYVTGTTPLMKDGKEIGYTITFSKGNPITIYHGKDGQDGEDGITPTISVKKDTDGVYYWTLNGEFIMVDGGKIQAEGKDGTNGTNGTTPQFKIENDYWFVSYDNGANWTQLGKATGEDGIGGDSMFSGVDYKTSTDYVIFTLADGTQIKLPTWSAFEALQRLCNETNTNLSALQTIVTALQNNDYITSVDPLTENGKVVGYTIKFAKSNPIVIYNGKDGTDGVDGNTPVIGVKKDGDGIYYWTLDGEFIIVDGQKIKAQYQRGSKAMTIPAHNFPTCRDVLVKCIKFVLPEDLDISGVHGHRRGLRGQFRRDDHLGTRTVAQERGAGTGGDDRTAAGRGGRTARRTLDGPADENRAERPPAGALRP